MRTNNCNQNDKKARFVHFFLLTCLHEWRVLSIRRPDALARPNVSPYVFQPSFCRSRNRRACHPGNHATAKAPQKWKSGAAHSDEPVYFVVDGQSECWLSAAAVALTTASLPASQSVPYLIFIYQGAIITIENEQQTKHLYHYNLRKYFFFIF